MIKQFLEEAIRDFRQRVGDCEVRILQANRNNSREEAQYQEGLKAGYLNSILDLAEKLKKLK